MLPLLSFSNVILLIDFILVFVKPFKVQQTNIYLSYQDAICLYISWTCPRHQKIKFDKSRAGAQTWITSIFTLGLRWERDMQGDLCIRSVRGKGGVSRFMLLNVLCERRYTLGGTGALTKSQSGGAAEIIMGLVLHRDYLVAGYSLFFITNKKRVFLITTLCFHHNKNILFLIATLCFQHENRSAVFITTLWLQPAFNTTHKL